MRTIIYLPEQNNFNQTVLNRICDAVHSLWKSTEIIFCCSEERFSFYSSLFENKVRTLADETISNSTRVVYYNKEDKIDCDLYEYSAFLKDFIGGIIPINEKINPDFYKHTDSNIFNKNMDLYGGYLLMPYHISVRYPCLGNINELGFKIPKDFQKAADRDNKTKLVVILGGSGSFDPFSPYNKDISSKLQQKLNSFGSCKYIVFNFSMPSAVITDEIMIYLNYVENLRPDYVISHDGFNEAVNAQINDLSITCKNNLIYNHYFELIAKKIYNYEELLHIEKVTHPSIDAESAVRSYISRKKQLQKIVCKISKDAVFINGLQPISYSKKKLSEDEIEYGAEFADKHFSHTFKKVPMIFEMFDKELTSLDSLYVNFNKIFERYNENDTLFGDPVHIVPDGSKIIAQKYFEIISSN